MSNQDKEAVKRMTGSIASGQAALDALLEGLEEFEIASIRHRRRSSFVGEDDERGVIAFVCECGVARAIEAFPREIVEQAQSACTAYAHAILLQKSNVNLLECINPNPS